MTPLISYYCCFSVVRPTAAGQHYSRYHHRIDTSMYPYTYEYVHTQGAYYRYTYIHIRLEEDRYRLLQICTDAGVLVVVLGPSIASLLYPDKKLPVNGIT